MSTLSLPNTIANGQAGDASKVQQNFDAIVTDSNANLIKKDGTLQMTGQLSLLASDPTLADHAARKSYVDAGDATEAAARVAGDKAPPRIGVEVKRNAALTVADAIATLVPFDTEISDSDGYFTPTSTAITVPAGLGGVYLISVEGIIPSGTLWTSFTLKINGAATAYPSGDMTAATSALGGITRLAVLAAGNTVTLEVLQNSGSTRTITVNAVRLLRISI